MTPAQVGFRVFAATAGRFPGYAYRLAPAAGWLAWRFNQGMRRRILRNQLAICEGNRERARRNTRAVFTAIVRYYVDIASIGRRDPSALETGTISFEHEERLAVLESGRPTIALSAHMGSPELAVQALIGRGRPFVALVEQLQPAWFGEELNRLRAAGGGTYLVAGVRGVGACLRELKAGGVVALVGDRDIQGNGLCVELCGRKVLLPAGPFELAQRTDAMIVPVLTTRQAANTLLLHVEEPFAIGLEDGAVRTGVERWATILEGYLARYPEQWTVAEDFWQVHRCG